jgi:hypothetical protein
MKKPIHDQGASIQVSQNSGDRSDIRVYRYGRVCHMFGCTQKLSTYTPGPYCNRHQHQGAMIELEKTAKRLKFIQKKALAKHKAKLDAMRGNKPKKSWNKRHAPVYIPDTVCVACGNKFYKTKDACNIFTKEYCRPCRPRAREIERNK